MQVIGPDEAKKLFPLLDTTGLRGGTWIASDDYVDPYSLTHAYAKGTRAGGVRILEGVAVTGFVCTDRRISAVETDQGTVQCDTVANAAGLWARHVGELAGIALPVTLVEHQYLVTEKSCRVPDHLPTLRDPDRRIYLKPEPGALAVGGWESGKRVVNGFGKLSDSFGQELLPDSLERIEEIATAASLRVPLLDELGVRIIINGPIPYRPTASR